MKKNYGTTWRDWYWYSSFFAKGRKDQCKNGLPLITFCNVSLAVHDDEHIERFKEEIRNIDEIMECYSTGGIYDFFVKVVLKEVDAYNQFVFEKLTKVHGIVKMQSSFVLNEIKHTTVLNIPKNSWLKLNVAVLYEMSLFYYRID